MTTANSEKPQRRETIEERNERVIRQLLHGPVFILDCTVEPIYTKKDVQKDDAQ